MEQEECSLAHLGGAACPSHAVAAERVLWFLRAAAALRGEAYQGAKEQQFLEQVKYLSNLRQQPLFNQHPKSRRADARTLLEEGK